MILNGHEVRFKRVVMGKEAWYCAYVTLNNSRMWKYTIEHMGNVTYHEDDVVGIDTAHAYNEGQTDTGKLVNAIMQMQIILNRWNELTGEGK